MKSPERADSIVMPKINQRYCTRKAQALLLHLVLPGCDARPVGVLLLDIGSDRMYCKIDATTGDEDTAEVLGYLAGDLIERAAARGGVSILDYLEDSLSNVLRVGVREQMFIGDPTDAVDRFFSERVCQVLKPPAATNARSLPFKPHVLVVEDNPADVLLIKLALREYCDSTDVTVAMDGEEAVQMIDLIQQDRETPDLVLLDLNLPKRSGHEVLESLRANPQLKSTPVAILSSSSSPQDISEAYRHGANYYLRKPADLNTFNQTMSELCSVVFQAAA